MQAKRKAAYRQGVMVLIGLAALTAIEYYLATMSGSMVTALFIIALVKAWVIMKYFMHVTSLWSEEEH